MFILTETTKNRFSAYYEKVKGGGSFLFRNETVFRFELVEGPDRKEVKTIWPARMWEKDIILRVCRADEDSNDYKFHVEEEDLECNGKQIYLLKQNRVKDVLASGSKNLYEILGLNMKEVRGKPFEEQNEIIKQAYSSQLLRWHSERNPENSDHHAICQDINVAYKILEDPEVRAAYNNATDYDCYKNRKGLLFFLGSLIALGVILTIATEGLAALVFLGVMAAAKAINSYSTTKMNVNAQAGGDEMKSTDENKESTEASKNTMLQ